MAKKFPLEIVIGATDKASAALRRVSERIDKFNEPFARLRKSFGQFADKTGLTGVGMALKNVGSVAWETSKKIATGFTLAGAAIGALIYKNAMLADSIGDTAARLNISTDALQAWQYGFGQADVDTEQFTSALDALNKNLGDAQIGMGRAVKVFRGIGIDPKKFKTIDELLPVLAQRLSRIHDPAKRAAIATRLLGDAGAQMAVKLGEGPQALAEMLEAARAARAIIGPDVIASAGLFDQTMKRVKATLAGVAGNALGRVYPALVKIAEGLQAAIVRYQPQLEKFADQFATKLPGYIEQTMQVLRSLGQILGAVMRAISWCNDNFGTTATTLALVAVTIGGPLLAALSQLGGALINLGISFAAAFPFATVVIAGVAAAVAAGWFLYKNWDKISDAIGGTIAQIVENFASAWDSVKSTAVSAFEWIVSKLTWLWENNPLFLAMKGVAYVAGKMGAGDSVGQPRGAPMGGALLQQQPAQRVAVSVDLSNLPAGTRASAQASPGVAFDLSRGYAMPGVR